MIALLGRRDAPTDAVEDYSRHLAAVLEKSGICMDLVRVPWAERGWPAALRDLRQRASAWNGQWALVQYTALAWSRRGVPLRLPAVLRTLKKSGVKIAVIFHDPLPFSGTRLKDRARRVLQIRVMRGSAIAAHKIISTLLPERVPWMQAAQWKDKFAVIPIGSNVPERWREPAPPEGTIPTVAVFALTERKQSEAEQAARIVRAASAQIGPIRLLAFGRGVPEGEIFLRDSLAGSAVNLELHGIVDPESVSALLAQSHTQLFVRSGIAARRGSVVAGISCGLPIVGWTGEETAFPVTEAGIRTAPFGDEDALVRELVAVLTDASLRAQLCQRSRSAAKQYFSWPAIAQRFIEVLGISPAAASRIYP